MESDRTRWDDRYRDAPPPSPAAPEALGLAGAPADPRRRGARALDVACGTGATSLWLAEGGVDVLALDVAPTAIAILDAGAEALGVTDLIDARTWDLDDGLPSDDVFDIVVCQRFRDVELYGPLTRSVAVGGVLCLTVLSSVGRDGAPGPFHAAPGELLDVVGPSGLTILAHDESDGVASLVAHRPARR